MNVLVVNRLKVESMFSGFNGFMIIWAVIAITQWDIPFQTLLKSSMVKPSGYILAW